MESTERAARYFEYVDSFADRWHPFVEAMRDEGFDASILQSGGMVMVLHIDLLDGRELMLGVGGGLPEHPNEIAQVIEDGCEWGWSLCDIETGDHIRSDDLPGIANDPRELARAIKHIDLENGKDERYA